MKRAGIFLTAALVTAFSIAAGAEAMYAWTCENGHEGNTGNFCVECGAAKPVEEAWACENGHEGNTGNFCIECGAQKPAQTWTCENGHEGNTGNFCVECGAAKPGTGSVPEPATEVPVTEAAATEAATEAPVTEAATEAAVTYDNPFPEAINRFTTPFQGLLIDHQVAISEVLSHVAPDADHYVVYDSKGIASEQLAWEKYTGPNHDLYIVSQNGGKDVYAYVYTFELDESQRTEWAAGSLFPNLLTAISSVLWVESGEDNDVYQQMLEEAAQNTDYDAVQRLMRSMEPEESALWFGHQVSMFREEPGGKDRYWVVFHNTEG